MGVRYSSAAGPIVGCELMASLE